MLYVFSITKSNPKSSGKRRDVEVAALHLCCSTKACFRRWTRIVCRVPVRIPMAARNRKNRIQGTSVVVMLASYEVSTGGCGKVTAHKNKNESSEHRFIGRSIALVQQAELSLQGRILTMQHVSPTQTRLTQSQAATTHCWLNRLVLSYRLQLSGHIRNQPKCQQCCSIGSISGPVRPTSTTYQTDAREECAR